ncbi:MAG: MFS transporter [Fidelibacterota bacterium]
MLSNITKLSVKEKIGYGLGDTASNLYFQMYINFLLFFYTDVFGIPAAAAGTLFMVSRFWDAVNDPMMGVIADRTDTKWGKFRPYLLWIMFPLAVIGVLMFTTPDLSTSGKIVYAYITYILMMMAYTAINIPYSALMGVLSPHSTERTSASTYRFVLAFVGAFIVQGLTLPLVNLTGQESEGCTINNQVITLTETGTKASKIIIEADDGQESTTTNFLVKVEEPDSLAPKLNESVDRLNLTQGFTTHTMALSEMFTLSDQGELEFRAKSSDEEVATVSLEKDHRLQIQEQGVGQTKVTVTAIYNKYQKTDYTFWVNILEEGNQPPELVAQLDELTYDLEEETKTINLNTYFEDDEPLTFHTDAENKKVVITETSNGRMKLELKNPGISKVTVTANDHRGGITETDFYVNVKSAENDPPAVYVKPENMELTEGYGETKIDVSQAFKDLDGDNLSLSVTKVNMAKGFPITMGIFGVLAMILFYITFASTKERVHPSIEQKTSLKNDLKDLLGNKPWMILLLMGIFTLGYVIIRMGTIMYYFKYYIGNELLAAAFMVTGTVAVIAGTASTQYLSKLLGKKKLYLIVMGLSSLLTILFYYVPKDQIFMIFAVHILISLVMAPQAPLLWAMYADTADYSEWKNGRRATGLIFSAATFSQKFGMAIGGGIAGWLLSMFDFEPNVVQSPETINGIKLMMSYIPAGATIIATVAALFYPLDDTTMANIEKELEQRNKDN